MAGTEKRRSTEPRNTVTIGVAATADSTSDRRGKGAQVTIFMALLLKSRVGRTHFELSQYGLKQGLSLEDVRNSPILLPPSEEQGAIIAYIDAEARKFATLTAEAERAIALLKERRSALISAAVTGKIDVRGLAPAVQEAA